MKKLLSLSLILPLMAGCGGGKKEESNIQSLSPQNGKIIILANDEVAEFVLDYTRASADKYRDLEKGDHYFMKDLTLEWVADGAPIGYEVKLSQNEDMSNAQVYTTEQATLTLSDLFVSATYYWQVTADYGNKKDTSKVFSFKTASTPRTIKIDGVSNTRDIGGYKTAEGKRIRQGLVYRAAYLDEITPQGKEQAIGRYGIKTDLDLRKESEGTSGSGSPLGAEIRYYHSSCPYYLGSKSTGIDNPENHENLAKAIKVFADESNYPVLFHCSVGRDRTGIVSMLLLGLLGAGFEDICMDYELSFFSYRGCLDGQTAETMVNIFINTYAYIARYKGNTQATFAENCQAYLLDIGVTQAEIDNIRRILL